LFENAFHCYILRHTTAVSQDTNSVPFDFSKTVLFLPIHLGCFCFGSGAYQHCSHEGSLTPMELRHSSPEALHTKRRERPLLAKDGTKAKEFS
jgi:hypothetical protein